MRKLFHFLGSAPLAIALIISAALLTIIGTLLESWSDSHQFAAQLIYQHPLFKTLLWLFFINILFAALRRWPFKRKHIPFLTTHLGLLMILAGSISKAYFGHQGHLSLLEGGETSYFFLPNTFALHVENREQTFLIPIKQKRLKSPFDSLKLTLVELAAHSKEHYEGWIKDDRAYLIGLPPFPVHFLQESMPQKLPISLKTSEYDIYALKTDAVEKIQNYDFPRSPSLCFIQDSMMREFILGVNSDGTRFLKEYDYKEFLIFDKGFGGYGVVFNLPDAFPSLECAAPLTHRCIPLKPERKKEANKPRLCLCAEENGLSEVIFLSYDPRGSGFKWPIFNGKYLVRFQAAKEKLPFSVRLREARQISYPHSSRPFSFESDLLFGTEEATISMNHVFEKKGYRFYMAGLSSSPMHANKAEIAVNHDPVKYWLTYPGGIVLALGIALLYLRAYV